MNDLKRVLAGVLAWRLALLAVAAVALSTIGYLFPYPNFQYLIELGYDIPLLWSWGGFDGVHYITIAEMGYIAEHTQAFFPVYPQIVRVFAQTFDVNELISGLVVAHVALFVGLSLFWKLLRLDFKKARSGTTILLFLLFPTAFYLGAMYTESLFLALVFGSFLAARKRNWLLAGALGAVASATRPVGVFLFPALLVELWLGKGRGIRKAKSGDKKLFGYSVIRLFGVALVPLGLIFYMIFLNNHFDDPLKFLHAQPEFGASRSDKIVLLYQVFWRYAKMMVTVDVGSILYFRVFQEVLWSSVFLVLGLLSFSRTRISYSVFAILAYIAPTLTGTFSSMPRYVLVMFSGFMVLSGWLSSRPRLRKLWYVVSGVLLLINMSLFLTGRWVA